MYYYGLSAMNVIISMDLMPCMYMINVYYYYYGILAMCNDSLDLLSITLWGVPYA